MKKTLVLISIFMITLSISACGKKDTNEIVEIQAQDNGRDTTTSELVTGDSAGTVIVDVNDTNKVVENTEEVEESAEGFTPSKIKENIVLGEWDCSDGSHWVLDNSFNLKYNKDGKEYYGSYYFVFEDKSMGFELWNGEEITETIDDIDEFDNVIGTHDYKYFVSTYIDFTIIDYEHNEDYTTGTLKLKNTDGVELTATMTSPIQEDKSVKSAFERKREFDKKQDDAWAEEAARMSHMTVEEYRQSLEAENAALAEEYQGFDESEDIE